MFGHAYWRMVVREEPNSFHACYPRPICAVYEAGRDLLPEVTR